MRQGLQEGWNVVRKGMVREDKRDLVKKGKVGHCRIGEGNTDYDTVI